MKKDKDQIKSWLSWAVWIIVIVILSRFMGGGLAVNVTMDADRLYLETKSGYVSQIMWEDIQSVELTDDVRYGVVIDGENGAKEKSGVWRNDEFGEYELCISTKFSKYIVCVSQSGHVIVFNYESEASTNSLYDAMMKKIKTNDG